MFWPGDSGVQKLKFPDKIRLKTTKSTGFAKKPCFLEDL
jgi:hypothetical protein